jgi:RNA recognition motif-containing protein
MDWPRRYG